MDQAIIFLTGAFPYSAEFQNVGIALQGAMGVRKGPNKEGKLHWFHAFMLSVLAAFAGGTLNFIWMGKPSGMIANDLVMGSCIIAYILVNLLPFDIGFMFFNTLPASMMIVSSAQLFRALGTVKFLNVAFNAFKDSPSAYYPIPVFGPIIYAILLANMGPLVLKGFEGHVCNGVPWAVQNGVFCATFYHFYANDQEGPIGTLLRKALPFASQLGLDDATFAGIFVSVFMQIMGILQMPEFLGPSFTPFGTAILSPFMDHSTWNVGKEETAFSKKQRNIEMSEKSSTSKSTPAATPELETNTTKKRNRRKKGGVKSKEKEL
mmetsp:Transcript_15554/g.20257  ORF Transcript_15554/g.20257 Transcript_15554/m.20257 type:complete len:320 (+) Transcript_15554:216-1175(+)|eukprot:CAMPEP_0198147316 /NCGR_PEP_ID=MMETSP1443-20131203/34633_1 /TAXON_ID=186043 /ORGANISM="Entomoneis sp., Strain CCMP2396" /LENGTH=319 /DNA_ID=CAMNT_0043811581 /DNA_START=186 /DNA_END=1145 /DNA_ORIENTATION=+